MKSLADALPKQIKRVQEKRERWLALGREHPGMNVGPACAMMKMEIEAAISALASGDVARMLAANADLAGYNDD